MYPRGCGVYTYSCIRVYIRYVRLHVYGVNVCVYVLVRVCCVNVLTYALVCRRVEKDSWWRFVRERVLEARVEFDELIGTEVRQRRGTREISEGRILMRSYNYKVAVVAKTNLCEVGSRVSSPVRFFVL